MRKSLFALESNDELDVGVEMEASVEEGEAAGALTDVADETGDITEMADAVTEGTEAAGQMEEVEALVADVAENGEGLDPVAAEAIRISVEAICARVGANPKAVYALYATENFQSASSRKANTRIALEGVGQFLKDLYAKIKAALTKMWEKVKAFWAKHVSTLGRVKKALDSMKAKVAASSGKFKDKVDLEQAPGNLADAFPAKGSVTAASVGKFVEAHFEMTGVVDDALAAIAANNGKAAAAAANATTPDLLAAAAGATFKDLGSASDPLVGGVYITYTVEKDQEAGSVTVTVDRKTLENKEAKVGLIMGDKAALKKVLDDTLVVINETIKIKDKSAKAEDSVKKLMDALGKAVNDQVKEDNAEDIKALRNTMKIANQLNAKAAGVNVEVISQNVRLAKAVLGFAALSLKNFKPV